MRYILIAVIAALALPAYAGPACDSHKNGVMEMCAKSYAKAMNRDYKKPFKNEQEKQEQMFGYAVCSIASDAAREDCASGRTAKDGNCEMVVRVVSENIDSACDFMEENRQAEMAKIVPLVSKERRATICGRLYSASFKVTRSECLRNMGY